MEPDSGLNKTSIAVIGMSCRFPRANNPEQLWENLRDGVECVTEFSAADLEAVGMNPQMLSHPAYVNKGIILEDLEMFDAAFFGISKEDAEVTDPQHRIFLEAAWHAVENAGYDPDRYQGSIGVYAGVDMSTYQYMFIYGNPVAAQTFGRETIAFHNDKDSLTARVAYKLNLKGPAVTVQTTCSTSMTAVIHACQSLLNYQCDIALAGGAAIALPQRTGYFYQEGGISSPDGHCRAFDAQARGTTGGSGAGVVVLKRLEEAIADGDHIEAIIRGFGINNDGSDKVGFTAPSVNGQAEAIAAAHAMAGVSAEQIGYVEAHGTGTSMGDPIEVAALTQVFRRTTSKKEFCGLGSLKTNIGHCNSAAGVAGVIKAVLSLKNGTLVPSLHFHKPNPAIDFANSPFYVVDKLREWVPENGPRRAGVSSFGIGGTNGHLVLEEAQITEETLASGQWHLLVLSAKTPSALETQKEQLVSFLGKNQLPLADVAYTLQTGRMRFAYRAIQVVKEGEPVTGLGWTNGQDIRIAQTENGMPAVTSAEMIKDAAENAQLLSSLGKLWLSGADIDWGLFYGEQKRRRVALPTYPFEKQRYWIDQNWRPAMDITATAEKVQPAMLYTSSWKLAESPADAYDDNFSSESGLVVVFGDESAFAETLTGILRSQGRVVVSVTKGAGFDEPGEFEYIINPDSQEDYHTLLSKLRAYEIQPDLIIHLWNCRKKTDRSIGSTEMFNSFYELFFLSKSIQQEYPEQPIQLKVVSTERYQLDYFDYASPEKALLAGICQAIDDELRNVRCQSIDLGPALLQGEQVYVWCEQVLGEIQFISGDSELLYRGGKRWNRSFQPVNVSDAAPRTTFRKQGTYLIAGEVEGSALKLVAQISEKYEANIVLVSPSDIPDKNEWSKWRSVKFPEHDISHRIRTLDRIHDAGGQVMIVKADLTNMDDCELLAQRVNKRFGKINGIIQFIECPLVPLLADLTEETVRGICSSIVDGAMNLYALYSKSKLDFTIYCYNTLFETAENSVLVQGAAGGFLDAFAELKNERLGTRYISVALDNGAFGTPPDGTVKDFRNAATVKTFEKILAGKHSRILVTTDGRTVGLKSKRKEREAVPS
jgi:polyketide synthase PksJ